MTITSSLQRRVRVSVRGLPTSGRGAMLAQALASIRSQDLAGVVEALVVYDRSVPDLALERTGDRPVRVLERAHTGAGRWREHRRPGGEGSWIAFLDDDDVWHPDKLAASSRRWRSPDRHTCVCTIATVLGGRRQVRDVTCSALTYADLLRNRTQSAHQSTVVVEPGVPADVVGLFDEDVPHSYMEDYDWLLRAAPVEPITVVPAALVEVRWHEASWFFDRWGASSRPWTTCSAKHPDLLVRPTGPPSCTVVRPSATRPWAQTEGRTVRRPEDRPAQPSGATLAANAACHRHPGAALPVMRAVRRLTGQEHLS